MSREGGGGGGSADGRGIQDTVAGVLEACDEILGKM